MPEAKPVQESSRVAKLDKKNSGQRSATALLLEESSGGRIEFDQLDDQKKKSPVAPVADVKKDADWGNQDVLIWLVPLLLMLFCIGIFSLFREDYSRKSKK